MEQRYIHWRKTKTKQNKTRDATQRGEMIKCICMRMYIISEPRAGAARGLLENEEIRSCSRVLCRRAHAEIHEREKDSMIGASPCTGCII
ncbi:unnamed protein product [Trichogramma brassicae]|uniref:Uncharacterized protein n=1 Tax=Trichogramma brassicae TaxID=86971 RepID=A0A6H5IHV6_9HYME|nr:unnamed protein product [Trichogramma brassicae]